MFTTRFQAWVRRNAERLGRRLGRLGVTPNQVTAAGMAATVVAGVLIAFDRLVLAGVVLAFSGTFDVMDGALARATKRMYPYGAFFDSTLDRYSEGAIYLGLAAYFLNHGGVWMRLEVLACMVALAGSFLVSYVKARAQSLGFQCDSGLFKRPERIFFTVAGLLLAPLWAPLLSLVVVALAVLTNMTVLQRINEVWGQARAQRRAREAAAAKAPAGGKTSSL